mmetsp:Transcript_55751/g.155396  ORF Transcript_55751/g.155396 Transcript_55751/m.155396 type:complete len:245 (+) Transcript_55751:1624-2358(+)
MSDSLRRTSTTKSFRQRSRAVTTPWRSHAPVTLRVYDVTCNPKINKANNVLRVIGAGAYHTAVEVYGREWSYGATLTDSTGVFWCEPCQCCAHTYREAVDMGVAELSQEAVDALLTEMCYEWRGTEYDLLRKNCCHFSDEFCERLGVGGIPTYLLNLASIGAKLDDTLEKGKQFRGVARGRSYHMGDLTRGIVQHGKDVRGVRDGFCLMDCLHGLVSLCSGGDIRAYSHRVPSLRWETDGYSPR